MSPTIFDYFSKLEKDTAEKLVHEPIAALKKDIITQIGNQLEKLSENALRELLAHLPELFQELEKHVAAESESTKLVDVSKDHTEE